MDIGVDEAGRGPVMGPMVVAAVAAEEMEGFREIGVKDSKALKPKRRETLSEEIRKRYPNYILVIEAYEIDDLRSVMTLNRLETKLFAKVIQQILKKIPEGAHALYLDAADTIQERFGEVIMEELTQMLWKKPPIKKVVSEHGADSKYPVVSAASIIAKVERDRRIGEIQKRIGDFGSGYPSDKKTVEFLKRWIRNKDELPQDVRKSWKTVKRLLNDRSQTALF